MNRRVENDICCMVLENNYISHAACTTYDTKSYDTESFLKFCSRPMCNAKSNTLHRGC